MENCMEARVSAVITTFTHILIEFYLERSLFFSQISPHWGF